MMNENPSTDNRWYPRQPMIGVGAMVLRDGCLLMVKRGKEPGRGLWSVPGGMMELGETFYEAVRREVREECDIDVEVEGVFDATETILRDDDGRVRYHFVLVDFRAWYTSGEIRAQSDAEECRWVPLRELAGLDMPDSLRGVLERNGLIASTGGLNS